MEIPCRMLVVPVRHKETLLATLHRSCPVCNFITSKHVLFQIEQNDVADGSRESADSLLNSLQIAFHRFGLTSEAIQAHRIVAATFDKLNLRLQQIVDQIP